MDSAVLTSCILLVTYQIWFVSKKATQTKKEESECVISKQQKDSRRGLCGHGFGDKNQKAVKQIHHEPLLPPVQESHQEFALTYWEEAMSEMHRGTVELKSSTTRLRRDMFQGPKLAPSYSFTTALRSYRAFHSHNFNDIMNQMYLQDKHFEDSTLNIF